MIFTFNLVGYDDDDKIKTSTVSRKKQLNKHLFLPRKNTFLNYHILNFNE